MKKEKWLNIPNILTTIRILIVPALLYVFFLPEGRGQNTAIWLFLAAGLTDCADGFLARRLRQVTVLGKVLDPIADKLTMATLLICLISLRVISWVALAVIAAKEIFMAFGAAACLRRKLEVSADIFGKAATVLFYPSVVMAWPWHGVEAVNTAGSVLVYCSLVLSVMASIHYTVDSVKKWNEIKAR